MSYNTIKSKNQHIYFPFHIYLLSVYLKMITSSINKIEANMSFHDHYATVKNNNQANQIAVSSKCKYTVYSLWATSTTPSSSRATRRPPRLYTQWQWAPQMAQMAHVKPRVHHSYEGMWQAHGPPFHLDSSPLPCVGGFMSALLFDRNRKLPECSAELCVVSLSLSFFP